MIFCPTPGSKPFNTRCEDSIDRAQRRASRMERKRAASWAGTEEDEGEDEDEDEDEDNLGMGVGPFRPGGRGIFFRGGRGGVDPRAATH